MTRDPKGDRVCPVPCSARSSLTCCPIFQVDWWISRICLAPEASRRLGSTPSRSRARCPTSFNDGLPETGIPTSSRTNFATASSRSLAVPRSSPESSVVNRLCSVEPPHKPGGSEPRRRDFLGCPVGARSLGVRKINDETVVHGEHALVLRGLHRPNGLSCTDAEAVDTPGHQGPRYQARPGSSLRCPRSRPRAPRGEAVAPRPTPNAWQRPLEGRQQPGSRHRRCPDLRGHRRSPCSVRRGLQ